MQPIDGFYLYSVGWQVHPITELNWQEITFNQAYWPMVRARTALNALLTQSVYQVKTCRAAGANQRRPRKTTWH